ncbi:DUF2061 domain-containing protein [Anderseniella sp. Alg231-50]|uniref:DUF2061 domain-containing protein n=1 Tax=Anderseniella sp. Alg231-50 TaxID=1922226 RepID=UPI000D54F9F6
MDTTTRLIVKSATWQIAGFVMMMLIGFLFTSSIVASGGIAIAGSITGFLSYFLHEMVWSKISWGRKDNLGAESLPRST